MTDADIANAEERINELRYQRHRVARDRASLELQRYLNVPTNMVTIAARHTERYIAQSIHSRQALQAFYTQLEILEFARRPA
jgi:hypothetical protein